VERLGGIRLKRMVRRVLLLAVVGIVSIAQPSVAASRPSVVLITLDSTRADRMGFLAGHGALTPKLDALAKQSVVFEQAYSQAPTTVTSHATILSGTYPQTHGASELGTPLAAGIPWLAEVFRARGYKTAAFVGSVALDPRNGYAPGFDRGFDVFDAGFTPSEGGPPVGQRTGATVAALAVKWIQARGSVPFFIWVHLSDAHFATGSGYDRAIAAEDSAVETLMTALRTAKVFDDAVVVVAADHGQSLGAHGEELHGVFLYDETTHVPLILKLPQQQMAGKQVAGRVSLVDVAPTVLEAAGVPVPSQMQGQSLLRIAKTKPAADQAVYARSEFPKQGFGWSVLESWRAGKYLYVRAPKPELFDLPADPGATRNLSQASKATLDTIAGQLQAFDSHLSGGGQQNAASGLSSSEAQKLASLGYVGMERSGGPVNAASSGTDPKDAIGVANKTMVAFSSLQQGKAEVALAAFQQVATSQPNTFLAQYGLGAMLAQRQQYKPAIESLHKAIELQPNSGWAHFGMGVCLVKTGDFKTAAVHLELATARLPEFSTAHRLLAESYEKLGRTKEAQAERSKIAASPTAK